MARNSVRRLTRVSAGALSVAALLAIVPGSAVSADRPRAAEPAAGRAGGPAAGGKPRPDARHVVIAVHGGAGTALKREDTTPAQEKAYRDGLAEALRAGQQVLAEGGSSVAAVEAAVRGLEDDPLFNAGKGAVFTEDAGHELDASVMRGSDLAAGAVAGVRNVRNPVSAARLVMERTRHVMLAGEGADDFAARSGLPTVTQDYYWTEKRWQELLRAKGRAKGSAETLTQGTVGAVAVDRGRNLAAATSTGGLTNKMTGRVGDSPVVGAGTYAKNATVAASATGAGEVFLRGAATGTISNLIEFGGRDLARAAYEVLVERLPKLGGTGGVIALNAQGVFDAPHSSEGMLHGYLTEDGRVVTKVFADETPANQ
ncbi:isoaspartyl peptidase/L-asparaginase [Streptomyces sp. NPDC052496]|uniref:isoaspartyl peptidase/L-asparaginase family protein n=1 Tax=Streptomyces sp. NPDC052496 TaxID=3154951 RepID=UPI0034478C3F